MQNPTPAILLVGYSRTDAEPIEAALGGRENLSWRLQRLEQPATAVARLAGGDVELAIVNISANYDGADKLSTFRHLHSEAAHVPILVIGEPSDQKLAEQAVSEGAEGFALKNEELEATLPVKVQNLLRKERERPRVAPVPPVKTKGGVIALLGAKGGVGTTTIALNVASALAIQGSACIVQIAAGCGLLRHFFQDLQQTGRRGLAMVNAPLRPADVAESLHKSHRMARVSALPGPRSYGAEGLPPDTAGHLVEVARTLADYVVVDLGCALTPTVLSLIPSVDFLGLVVERDHVAVSCAEYMRNLLEEEGVLQKVNGTIVVNRYTRDVPLELTDLEQQLGLPMIAVIPPSPEHCVGAHKARKSVIALDPESLLASCLVELAQTIAFDFRTVTPLRVRWPAAWKSAAGFSITG